MKRPSAASSVLSIWGSPPYGLVKFVGRGGSMCVSEESDLIDNTKIANYKLFKYTMNCGNSEATLGIAAGGGNAQPLGFNGASYTRRVCTPHRPRRGFSSRPACAS